MLGILLTILRIIGLALLIILGILVVLLLCILIAPVKYNIEAAHEGEYYARFNVSYLLRLVRAMGCLDSSGFNFTFKILWFEPFKDKTDNASAGDNEDILDTPPVPQVDVSKPGKPVNSATKPATEPKSQPLTISSGTAETTKADTPPEPEKYTKPKKIDKINKSNKKAKKKQIKSSDKEPGIIAKLKALWDDKHNQNAIKHVFNVAIRLLRKIFPRSSEGNIIFSLGEPDLTGQCLGIMSLMPVFYGKRMHVRPDFESEDIYINGHIRIIGQIRPFILVKSAIELFRDKELRRLIKKIRN